MYALTRPSEGAVRRFIYTQSEQPFSYRTPGASRATPPRGFTVDQYRVKLGSGAKTFERGAVAINRWKMFEIGWVELCFPSTPPEPGAVVGVLAHHFGFWSLHACRVVYTLGESSPLMRAGFAYGTLAEHAESGEELFTVEWNPIDDSVWFCILAFSKPNQILSKAGYPVTRMLQKRFAGDALQAMVRAVQD